MQTGYLVLLDWVFIVGYVIFALALGIYHSRKSLSSMTEYFVSGKRMPWWILGTSIVATTFAADTPLAISALVVRDGIWGNWFWWNGALGGLLAVMFVSRLWVRANILTDTEFVEVRYGGKSAAFLRGFRALYFGLPWNCFVMGWVNLAMAKIIIVVLDLPDTPETKFWAVMFLFAFTLIYTCLSGLTGVMLTDFVQFILAMLGSIYLAFIAVRETGGMDYILSRLNVIYSPEKAESITAILPTLNMENIGASLAGAFGAFLIYIGLSWWTTGNTDGGGYIAQRLLSAKNEKHAYLGLFWFNIAHYCLRPWPWIIVGLCAAVLYPHVPDPVTGVLPDPELGYIRIMVRFLPAGLLGLVVASFFAAYMSTIDTQMNWGASYLTNDFYKRFIKKDASQKHYVKASVISTIIIAFFGAIVTYFMDSIVDAWRMFAQVFAGIGTVYLLRWFWWRINAWSEISAITTSLIGTAILRFFASERFNTVIFTENIQAIFPAWLVCLIHTLGALTFPHTLLVLIPLSMTVWISVTLLTRPVDDEKLIEFYKRVRPPGPGWKRIAVQCPDVAKPPSVKNGLMNYLLAVVTLYCVLIGFGEFVVNRVGLGLILITIAVISGFFLVKRISMEKWDTSISKPSADKTG